METCEFKVIVWIYSHVVSAHATTIEEVFTWVIQAITPLKYLTSLKLYLGYFIVIYDAFLIGPIVKDHLA